MPQFFSGPSPIVAPRAPDYRTGLSQALIQSGVSAPARNPVEGLGNLAKALSGAYIGRMQKQEQETRDKAAQETLARALAGFDAPMTEITGDAVVPSGGDVTAAFADFNPGSSGIAQSVSRDAGPDEKMSRLVSALAGNSDLAPIAMNLQLSQVQAQAEAQRAAANAPRFEPVFDDVGNIIGQRNVKTGKVESDPRATKSQSPVVETFFDAEGDEYKAQYDPKTGDWRKIGGSKNGNKPDKVTPYTDLAKATVDFRNGLISPEAYEAIKLETGDSKPSKDDFDSADKLRDEFTARTKNFRESTDAYRRVVASAEDPSPAGDLSLIFNYMKVLDPGSVVRESEFATAAASGSYGQRIQSLVTRALTGNRLADGIRADFVDRAKRLYGAQTDGYNQSVSEYTRIAEGFGVDPAMVVTDMGTPMSTNPGEAVADDVAPLTPEERDELEKLRKEMGISK